MVREDEMRERYKEYRPSKTANTTSGRTFESREPKVSFFFKLNFPFYILSHIQIVSGVLSRCS